jgi:hypothetical protein
MVGGTGVVKGSAGATACAGRAPEFRSGHALGSRICCFVFGVNHEMYYYFYQK